MGIRSGRTVRMVCFGIFFLLPPGLVEAGRVRGTVVDREGKPAAGATVWAGKLGSMEPLDTREATADGSGAFVLEEVGTGRWIVFGLRGDEGGRVSWDSVPHVEEGKDPAPVTVRLGLPTRFKGRLFDAETGQPLAGGRFALDNAQQLEVDGQGRFETSGLEMTNHEAYPLCPGYERKRILFDTTGRPDAELELKLPRAGKVIGRVLDSGGKPVPGATIGLRTSGSILSGSALWERCAEDGRFSYDGKPLGRTSRIAAHAPGYQIEERDDIVALDPSNPTEANFTLQLDPTKTKTKSTNTTGKSKKEAAVNRRAVSGTIVGPEGKPVAAAVVRWGLLVSSDSVPETKTDAKGAFHLEGIPDETGILSVMAKGLVADFPQVAAGGDRQVKVELKTGATIRGRVVDEEGHPIEAANVVPVVNNPGPNWRGFVYLDEFETKTDRHGRYILEGMPKDVKCDVVAPAWSAVRGWALSPSDESKNLVTLRGGGAIRGRVVDPLGGPVKNFRVQVGIPKGSKPGEAVGGYFAGYSGIGLTFTRDDGEFTISGLTAGNLHHLTVITDKFGVGEADRIEAQSLARLKPADELKIQLGPGHTLRVRVFSKAGKQVEGARVTAIQNEGQGLFQWGISDNSWEDSVTARANTQGWAEFPFLPFGKGSVVVRAKGYSRLKLDWTGEEELEAFVFPEATISGTVLDEAGKPVAGSRVMLMWGEKEVVQFPTDPKDGRFQVDGLGPDKYILHVDTAAVRHLASDTIELEAGQKVTKEIRVKPVIGKP